MLWACFVFLVLQVRGMGVVLLSALMIYSVLFCFVVVNNRVVC